MFAFSERRKNYSSLRSAKLSQAPKSKINYFLLQLLEEYYKNAQSNQSFNIFSKKDEIVIANMSKMKRT